MTAEKPKPVLLDLFSCAGGAALGYRQAGFVVVGVDINPAAGAHYLGDSWFERDALGLDAAEIGTAYDAIHASPPCQAFSSATPDDHDHPDLIEETRALLEATGLPYVIENVPQAPLINAVKLCGSSFGLQIRRHRLFETNWMVWAPPHCAHAEFNGRPYTVTGHFGGRDDLEHHRPVRDRDHAAELMEMPKGLPGWCYTEAIPPVYTKWLGEQMIETLKGS